MPNVSYRSKNELVLHIEQLDSMGRTQEQVDAMEKNDLRPRKPGRAERDFAVMVAAERGEYPKVLYRLALKNGLPAGDIKDPSYPLPYDLAAQLGLSEQGFRRIGQTKDSPGNLIVRLPWITRIVGAVKEDESVDVEAAKAEEARLVKAGWVDSPSKIKGLPTPPAEQEYDALPDDKPSNGHARA